MSYNVWKFIEVMAMSLVSRPRWRRRRHGNVDAIGRRGGRRLANASPLVIWLAVGAWRHRSGRGVVTEPGSWRCGCTVAAQWLVDYETAVVTTWRGRCEVSLTQVIVGARGTANKRYSVVERRTASAVITIDTILVVGCQLVTWLKLVLVATRHNTSHDNHNIFYSCLKPSISQSLSLHSNLYFSEADLLEFDHSVFGSHWRW